MLNEHLPPRSDLRAATSVSSQRIPHTHGVRLARWSRGHTQTPDVALTVCRGAQRRRGSSSEGHHLVSPKQPVPADLSQNPGRFEIFLSCLGIALVLSLLVEAPQRLILLVLEALQ